MKRFTYLAAIAAAVSCSVPSFASYAGGGYVTSVKALANNNIYFTHTGTRSQLPSCQANSPDTWKFDGTSPAGQIMLATLLTAYANHRQVYVEGTGACNADDETVQSVTSSN